jgi:hypothetical protein
MAIQNLPAIIGNKLDGNLTIVPVNNAPIVLILGTASQGVAEALFRVDRPSDASSTFGKTGTLARGMFEASVAGALNIRLFRFGSTPAILDGVGNGAGDGLTITTVRKDDSAGGDYSLFYDDAAGTDAGRLRIYRTSDDLLVYDNNPSDPSSTVDLGEIAVEGSATGAGGGGAHDGTLTIGSLASPVTLSGADLYYGSDPVFTAGDDGLSLSRMETYEGLYNAYQLLDSADVDVVIPMDVHLDDLNVMDMSEATVSGLALTSLSDYPTKDAANDALGKVFVQEYEGENHFWWWMPSQPNADADTTFTADGGANIWPTGVGSASATLDADGNTLTGSDFHEVNFAYQLANFCYISSRDNKEMTGAIGVLPPTSFALKAVSNWIGKLPTTEEDSGGNTVIAIGGNGTGLLGNKFMTGKRASAEASGEPGLSIDSIDGLFNGGFIATETGWLDDLQLKDDNDALRDIGKYISVVGTHPVLSNPSRAAAYTAPGAATYGGFYSVLPAESAPTNKLLRQLRLPFRINTNKLDLLAGQRYVFFNAKTRGILVADAPTAARPDSDYQRLATVRQVKAAVDAVRRVGEPFIGEGLTGARIAALDTAIDGALKALVRQGVLVRYESQVTSTPTQRVLGEATVELVLVPAFELRRLTLVISLSAT